MREESTETFLSEQDEGNDLFSYIEDEDFTKIEDFLKNKPNIWEYRDNNNDKSTVLHIAVFKKSYRITKTIIEHCQKYKDCNLEKFINVSNDKGVTALHYASFIGNIKIIQLLIDNKANLEAKTERGLNIIHYSAQGNKPNSLMYFYIKKNEITKKLIKGEDKGGSTPIHWAAYSNAEDALMYLINLDIFQNENKRQEFINKQDNQKYTPLHLSVTSKSRRIVMKLLQSGAKVDIEDIKNRKPLDIAISKGYQEIIEILKNNQNCQICNFKAPVKQIKKSKQNIYIVFIFLIITTIILYVYPSLIIIALYNKINENENHDLKYFKICCFFIYNIFFLLFLILYFILLCKDPGEMKKNDLKELEKLLDNELNENKKGDDLNLAKYCYKCYIEKKNYSKHCIVCDRFYKDFDHHCYWINKCVAKNNYNIFISFLFITFFYLCFVLIIDGLGFYNYFNIEEEKNYIFEFYFINLKYPRNILPGDNNKISLLVSIIILLIINLLFLIPVFLLLILHLKVCCSNLKLQRRASSIHNEYLLGNNVESSVLNIKD